MATIFIMTLGALLILGGILFGFIPGLPGILLSVLGFALISTQYRWMARLLDRIEMKLARISHQLRGK